ncbi:MAG: IS21 family transposase [Hyphomicrobiales bacterium]|nr:MAG: IS21 family transposase [Hyphomicrobiales bacterium]
MVNLKEWMMILELHQQGLTVSAIAERTGHDRKTVRKVISRGLVVPKYAPRTPRPTLLGPYEPYLRERVAAWPELSGVRLLGELRERGYAGGVTQLNDFVRAVRPRVITPFEVRFETPAGRQAQVDFAHFMVEFTEQPGVQHRVWLFAIVLGHSRYLWAHYVLHQDLGTVLRCHMLAFEHFGGTPREILYDRMKTAVLGEAADDTGIVYNAKLIGLGAHYGFKPRACKAYRAKTKGKIERPFRYVRANFFLARSFANLEDLNHQLRAWLDTVANARVHGSTGRIVAEHFAAERASLKPLPAGRFDAVLRTERRVSHEGMVSVGGNLYSVPDGTSKRVLEVETTADCVRIHDGHRLVAVHALLHGRRQRSLLPGHRQQRRSSMVPQAEKPLPIQPLGHSVARRGLEIYAAVAERLGAASRAAVPATNGAAR